MKWCLRALEKNPELRYQQVSEVKTMRGNGLLKLKNRKSANLNSQIETRFYAHGNCWPRAIWTGMGLLHFASRRRSCSS
jgi:hypothetical protein